MKELTMSEVPQSKKTSYPWDRWLCGKPVSIEKGEDFHVLVASMCTQIHKAAKVIGYECTVRARGNVIFIVPKEVNDE